MNKADIAQSALQLSTADRLELVEQIWESLDSAAIPVPSWQLDILDRRVAEADAQPERFTRWEEARARILSKIEPKDT